MKDQNGCTTLALKSQGANLEQACGRRKMLWRSICVFIVIMAMADVLLAQNPQTPPTGTRQPGSRRGRAARATALAQPNAQPECTGVGTSLVQIPEIKHSNGTLQAVIISADQSRNLWPISGAPPCNATTMRYYWGYPQNAKEGSGWWANWLKANSIGAQEPIPGPTLRARVGDQIQILFLNQINPQDFSNSQDLAQCDISSNGYPGSDTFPDCIHSSTTTNIHFHGTHTTPSTTGDNVLLQILANPNGKTQATPPIAGFFTWCAKDGTPSNWPPFSSSNWLGQLATLQMGTPKTGKGLIGKYDTAHKTPYSLWQSNKRVIQANGWPQYYYGAFPYCFKLPDYNKGGVKMGQAPGTHWYHAHKHGSTNINVANGMTGALIIEGSYDDWLNNFYGQTKQKNNLQQQVMVIQQLSVSSNLKKNVVPPNFPGPAALSVNGRLTPVVTMQPGQVQLWRIVNSASRDLVTLCPPAGANWQQIAQDGVQLAFQNVRTNQPVSLAAGNRADLLIQAPSSSSTTNIPVNVFSGALAPPASPAANCTAGSDPAGDIYGALLNINVTGTAISPAQPLLTAANYSAYWVASTREAAGAVIMPLANNPGAYFFTATAAGATGNTSPLFQNAQTQGATITDGSVTWRNIGPKFSPKLPGLMPIPRFLADIQPNEVRVHREVVFNSVPNSTTAAPTSAPPPVVTNPNPPPDLTPGTAKKFPPTNSHYINDVQFSDERVDQAMLLDTVEEWKVMNFTDLAPGPNPWHPFHIHINPFQVTEVFSPGAVTNWSNPSAPCYVNPLDPATWVPCTPLTGPFVWWDVFAIPTALRQLPSPVTLPPAFQQYQQYVQCTGTPSTCTITAPSLTSLPAAVQPYVQCAPGTPSICTLTIPGYFKMRTRFSDYTGQYVLHCHILAHEDRGMMELVEVVPNTTMQHH